MAAVNPQLALLSMKGQTLQRARAELARCKADIEKCIEVVEKAMESDAAIAAEILSSVQVEVDRLRQQEEELVQDQGRGRHWLNVLTQLPRPDGQGP